MRGEKLWYTISAERSEAEILYHEVYRSVVFRYISVSRRYKMTAERSEAKNFLTTRYINPLPF